MDQEWLLNELPVLLRAAWRVDATAVAPSPGPPGMGSVTVQVDVADRRRFVATWVPAAAVGALDRGSAVAHEVDRAGVPTGPALPTRTGALSAPLGGGRVALLHRVPGHPLVGGSPEEQRQMAAVLARVHAVRRLSPRTDPYLADALVEAHAVEEWVLPAVRAVVGEYAQLPALSWGLVHHDPAPEAFRLDPATGDVALIDWTGAGEGPVLFDVASALMYLGGLPAGQVFLDAYLDLAPDGLRREAAEHLPALRRFRGAVQAAYFSTRVATGDRTGICGPADNLRGLHHARRMLVGAGVGEAALAGSGPVLRPMRHEDLEAVVRVQEEASVVALGHLFPQDTTPFPRGAVLRRWRREVGDTATDCFVVAAAADEVLGFAATRGEQLLHLGTALHTWGSGLARRAHDEVVAHLEDQGHPRSRLWVFEGNGHARRFYEHLGWTPTGERSTSPFPPYPVLLASQRDLRREGPIIDAAGRETRG